MPYATAQDMIDSFGEREIKALTDVGETRLDAVDETVLARAIKSASDLIDGYLVGRYNLPLSSTVPALTVHCTGLARYLLMSSSPDDRAKADYAAAIAYLSKVAAGTIALVAPAQAQQPSGLGQVAFTTGQKVFAREED